MSPLKEGHRTTETPMAQRKHQSVVQNCSMMTPSNDGQSIDFLAGQIENLREIVDDLIDDMGIDARHSFEDGIQPVTEAKRLYGDRVALPGGIDVDYLCRSSEEEVRAYTRRVIEACAPRGG